ncbi:MAG: NAD(P)-binding domain-containing protein [Actinomycetaceae bacterium]|nr:NAD(P)-binding domain-containing protein [Actinomycetaceae bacterium]MDY6083128.1 NAD(P)-binding domain-containing protein [Actinomycetaceae bacterium]
MTTAIIGMGNIGRTLARHLTDGGERVLLVDHTASKAQDLANELGETAQAVVDVKDALDAADYVIPTIWFAQQKEFFEQNADSLHGKVIIDPSNAIEFEDNGPVKIIGENESAGELNAARVPSDAHFVKTFGTLSADELRDLAHSDPRFAVFYATDDDVAGAAAEKLIAVAGFDPVNVGGIDQSGRIEVFGDLHPFGGLDGKPLTKAQAEDRLAK